MRKDREGEREKKREGGREVREKELKTERGGGQKKVQARKTDSQNKMRLGASQ